jgi:hypothetical protein
LHAGKIKTVALTNFDTERLQIILENGIPVVSNQVLSNNFLFLSLPSLNVACSSCKLVYCDSIRCNIHWWTCVLNKKWQSFVSLLELNLSRLFVPLSLHAHRNMIAQIIFCISLLAC